MGRGGVDSARLQQLTSCSGRVSCFLDLLALHMCGYDGKYTALFKKSHEENIYIYQTMNEEKCRKDVSPAETLVLISSLPWADNGNT
jgi:hypothetical protein